MRLREIFGGAARGRSLTVAGVSAVAGAITGVVIGTMSLAGASSPHVPAPVQSPQHKHVRHHRLSPTPYVATTYTSTPSHTPSPSASPTRSASPTPTPKASSPAPTPSQTMSSPTPTSTPTTTPPATSSPGDGGGGRPKPRTP